MMVMLPNDTITITHKPSVGPDDKGWRTTGTPDSFPGIIANVQPLTAKEKIMLPEGDREKESRIILIDLPALTIPLIGDEVLLASDGSIWILHSSDPMPGDILPHYEIIALRKGT